jgi:hypothetical protein
MQATIVMMIALSGLGCQNAEPETPSVPPDASSPAPPAVAPLPSLNLAPLPSPYPADAAGQATNGDISEDNSFGECVRKTFCSFFIGRDPDVASMGQIEAAYHAGQYSR